MFEISPYWKEIRAHSRSGTTTERRSRVGLAKLSCGVAVIKVGAPSEARALRNTLQDQNRFGGNTLQAAVAARRSSDNTSVVGAAKSSCLPRRPSRPMTAAPASRPSDRQLALAVLRDPATRNGKETEHTKRLGAAGSPLDAVLKLAQSFADMLPT